MLKCKSCGTANSPDSLVCVECGAKLRVNRKQSTKKKKTGHKPPEDIFSTSQGIKVEKKEEPIKDVFSSDEAYEKVRVGTVLEKIHELEEEIGDTSEAIDDSVDPPIVPKVINRTTTTDLIRPVKPKRNPKDKKHDIPTRIIESQRLSDEDNKNALQASDKQPSDSEKSIEIKKKTADERNTDQNKKSGSQQNRRRRNRPKRPRTDSIENAAAMSTSKNSSHRSASVEDTAKPDDEEKLSRIREEKDESTSVEIIEQELLTLSNDADGKQELPAQTENEERDEPIVVDDESGDGKSAEAEQAQTKDNADDHQTQNSDEEKPKTVQLEADEDKAAPASEITDSAPEQDNSADENFNAEDCDEPTDQTEQTEEKASESSPEQQEPVIRQREIPAVSQKLASEKHKKAASDGAPVKKKKKPAAQSDKATKAPAAEDDKPRKKASAEDTKAGRKKSAENVKSRKVPSVKKSRFDKDDIEANRFIAALAYMGIFIIVPFMKRDESEFCRAHVKQGAVVFAYSVIVELISYAVVMGLRALLLWVLGLSVIIYNIFFLAILAAMLVLVMIPSFNGAVAAFSGIYKKVPLVSVKE